MMFNVKSDRCEHFVGGRPGQSFVEFWTFQLCHRSFTQSAFAAIDSQTHKTHHQSRWHLKSLANLSPLHHFDAATTRPVSRKDFLFLVLSEFLFLNANCTRGAFDRCKLRVFIAAEFIFIASKKSINSTTHKIPSPKKPKANNCAISSSILIAILVFSRESLLGEDATQEKRLKMRLSEKRQNEIPGRELHLWGARCIDAAVGSKTVTSSAARQLKMAERESFATSMLRSRLPLAISHFPRHQLHFTSMHSHTRTLWKQSTKQ